MYDIEWAPGVKYRDVRFADELQSSVYNFEIADVDRLRRLFDEYEAECKRLLGNYDEKSPEKKRYPVIPAYEQVLKCSHLFNLLDARGAISVTERVGDDQTGPRSGGRDGEGLGGSNGMNFLLEIGTEEIPHWMIPAALKQLAAFDLLGAEAQRRCDAAPVGRARDRRTRAHC